MVGPTMWTATIGASAARAPSMANLSCFNVPCRDHETEIRIGSFCCVESWPMKHVSALRLVTIVPVVGIRFRKRGIPKCVADDPYVYTMCCAATQAVFPTFSFQHFRPIPDMRGQPKLDS